MYTQDLSALLEQNCSPIVKFKCYIRQTGSLKQATDSKSSEKDNPSSKKAICFSRVKLITYNY